MDVTALMRESGVARALQQLEAGADRVLEEAVRICQIPSPTFDEGERAAYVRARFEALRLTDVAIDADGTAALELAFSGTSPANLAVPTMAGIHSLIGIGEGLITAGALALIYATRPDLVRADRQNQAGGAALQVVGLIIALALAIASPLASAYPDGLEWVAEQRGFLDTAQGPAYQIIPDYVVPGVSNEALATILAGVVGTLIVFGIAAAVAYSKRNRKSVQS